MSTSAASAWSRPSTLPASSPGSRSSRRADGRQAFGTAASPALHKDRVIVVNDNTSESYIAAYAKTDGREMWRVKREEVENWSTPYIWENELRTEIVTAGLNKVRSYDLDGKLLWELKGMTVNVVPTPFSRHGLVYINSGYPGGSPRPVYAIRPGASGDISLKPDETSNEFIVWYQPLLGTYNTSSLAYGDIYYTLLDRGFLLAHDAKTGKPIYGRQRIPEASGFTASPWAYNGKVFLLSEEGDTYVIEAGPEFKVVGKNALNDMALATPAVVRGSLIIRTQSKLFRIAKDAGAIAPDLASQRARSTLGPADRRNRTAGSAAAPHSAVPACSMSTPFSRAGVRPSGPVDGPRHTTPVKWPCVSQSCQEEEERP